MRPLLNKLGVQERKQSETATCDLVPRWSVSYLTGVYSLVTINTMDTGVTQVLGRVKQDISQITGKENPR